MIGGDKEETGMGYVEEKLRALEAYRPALTREADFDAFWERTLAQTRARPLAAMRARMDCPLPGVQVFDIAYQGFDDTPIHGWLLLPQSRGDAPVPCLVHYHGFGGSRGQPWDFAPWLLAGLAVVSVDCREQGGLTGNRAAYDGGMARNVACKGIQNKEAYYFRAVYMDCLRAVDFALSCPEIDPGRIALEGGSQGGALVMAVGALDARPAALLADVPSNSDLRVRVEGAHGAFGAVRDYLKLYPDETDEALRTLSYFDTMNLAERIGSPLLASVGLLDDVCPARCFFATYNRVTAPKHVIAYPFAGHEGGGSRQLGEKLAFLGAMGWLS